MFTCIYFVCCSNDSSTYLQEIMLYYGMAFQISYKLRLTSAYACKFVEEWIWQLWSRGIESE